jgi:hemoglobin-like flavoprotein
MSLTQQQVEVLQSSFRILEPLGATAADLFYRRLFELDPSVVPLFKGNMNEQGRKFMQVLAVAVGGMSSLPTLAPVIRQLGARHAIYGVQPQHYESVRDALLWALARVLQDAYTEEVRTTWATAYAALAGVMKEAAWGRP